MKDLKKRKRVMQRSMRLGHCICDPKKPCPCDLFRKKDVCLCAGERLDAATGPVRLTRLVDSAGCASKIDQAALKRVLADLPSVDDPRVLVGVPAGDDAGVYKMNGGPALVQSVDVFSPSVDDPYTFGQVAAANSVSDIYAMAGRPITALSILGFPIGAVPDEVMRAILAGGIDKMNEAGVAVIGGHSINDKEIKAGFAVTGAIDPDRVMTNAHAQVADVLILTKPIGTGILAFASQIDRAPQDGLEASIRSMTTLNKAASELMLEFGAHACTDVTGFGLVGHLAGMGAAANVDVEVVWDEIPVFNGVLQCAADGIASGAVERNREFAATYADPDKNVTEAMLDICYDPQTSGGLLIAIEPTRAQELLKRLKESGLTNAAVIGKVLRTGSGRVLIRTTGMRAMPAAAGIDASEKRHAVRTESVTLVEECCVQESTAHGECCAKSPAPGSDATTGVAAVGESFRRFLGAVNAPGALDAHTKQSIAIALSVSTKCEPCTRMHIKKAKSMGFSEEEIDEAAWMAVAFGGSPTMMFYERVKNS